MRHRVYKLQSGEVVVDTPSKKRYQGENFDKCPHPWRFRENNPNREPFELEIVTTEQLEALVQGTNEAGSAQFFYEGKKLKHDNDWSELIMPEALIRQKHRNRLERKLDEELDKPNPDPVKLARLQRQKDKLKNPKEAELLELSLQNMDEDGIEKPKVRAKIAKRLKELKGK